MIMARIRHIFKNYNKKMTIYDYMQEPEITLKKGNIYEAKYEARPVFNSIRVGENKKKTTSKNGYRKYRMKNGKNRITIYNEHN